MFTTMHPVTHVERDAFGLARIGRSWHDLVGIRYTEGEGGNAPAGSNPTPGTPAAPTSTPPGTTPPANPSAPPAPNTDPTPGSDPTPSSVRFEDLDERTQAYVRGLRSEAAEERTKRTAAEQARDAAEAQKNKVLAALGLKPDGSEQDPDPAELEGRLTEATSDVENTKRENLVLRIAPGLGGNVDRLLDSRSFTAKLAGLKVDDRDGVTNLIREALEQDSTLKSAPAPAASSGGTQHTGTTPSGQRMSKSAALSKMYGDRVLPNR